MPFNLVPISSKKNILIDEKGLVYDYSPKKKLSGKGLTMSKAFLDSWVLPVRVEVCEISHIDEMRYVHFIQDNHISIHYTHLPRQAYYYHFGELVPVKALKLPYRIYVCSTNSRGGIWYMEDKTDFNRLCQISAQAKQMDRDTIVQFASIEQHPSGESISQPLAPINPPRPLSRYPSIDYQHPSEPIRIGQVR